MPHRLVFLLEQVFTLKAMLLASAMSALAGAQIQIGQAFDIFSTEPVNGNASFCLLVAGALGGAFAHSFTYNNTRLALDSRSWRGRVMLSAVSSVTFTPFVIMLLSKVQARVFNIEFHVVPNAPVILFTSAVVAIGSKYIIRFIQNRMRQKFNDQEEDKP